MTKKRVLVVGLGNMGMSHALAYTRIPGFEVVGVCTRRIDKREAAGGARRAPSDISNYEQALAELKPDVVSINTLPDTHADYRHQGDGGGRARLRREAARRDGARAPSRSWTPPGARARSW